MKRNIHWIKVIFYVEKNFSIIFKRNSCIRTCSLCTLRSHLGKSMSLQDMARLAEDAHLAFASLLCRFFILQVLQFVSQRITLWKSARFHVGWRSNPYPPHYTEAFASSTILYPHPVRLLLRLAYLSHVRNRRDTGLPSSVQATHDRLRVHPSTGSATSG